MKTSSQIPSRWRTVACAAAFLVALGGCVGEEMQTSPGTASEDNPPAKSADPPKVASADSPASASKAKPPRPRVRRADGAHGAVAPGRYLKVTTRRTGGGEKLWLDTTNPLGQRLVFLIVRTATGRRGHEWLQVSIPERPMGSKGWVRREAVQVVRLRHRVEVDLSRFVLKHYRRDKLVNRFTVGIGQDQYPTPKGSFYVWARVPQPSPTGPYGVYALGISGFSPVLSDWAGGGRAAIHGTAVASDRGAKVSHGCVRVFNDDMRKLTRLPMGTPVIIRS